MSKLEHAAMKIADRWPEIVPLHANVPPELPTDQWPPVLREYIDAASAETETPKALPAMLALGVISAAVRRAISVEVKPGYIEPVNIFVVVSLPPATRKSAEFKRACAPLKAWERVNREAMDRERRIEESKIQTHNQRVSDLRKKAAKAQDDQEAEQLAEQVAQLEADAPQVPEPPRLFTGDVTTERLGAMMQEHNECMAVMAPEGGIIETMGGRYSNQVPNFDLYLSGHAGEAVRVDRGSRPAVILDNPRLTVCLAVQPDVISTLSTQPGFHGRGLIGRFLHVVPESNLGNRKGDGPPMNPGVLNQYEKAVEALIDVGKSSDGVTVKLSPEAAESWRALWSEVESGMLPGERFEHMRDWAGKAPGAAARIAGLFHAFTLGAEYSRHPISAEHMNAAADTIRALADHAAIVYDQMGSDSVTDGARHVLRWIQRKQHSAFTARECHQAHRSRFPRTSDLEPIFAMLTERGYIRETESATGKRGRPSVTYEVNPGVEF